MKTKLKVCAYSECGEYFRPYRSTDRVCSAACAHKWKAEKEAKRVVREEKKTAAHVQDLQEIFNRFIKLRDWADDCISCNKHKDADEFHAGHSRTTGAAPNLRFDEFNVHKQCRECNIDKGGNHDEYRTRLIQKIGIKEVERIDADNQPKHYTAPELIALKTFYMQQIKELKKSLNLT